MSLIPLDEPRGDDGSTPGEGAQTDTVVGRLWERLTSAFRAFLPRPSTRPRGSDSDESTRPALEPAEKDRGSQSSAARTDTGRQKYITTEHDGILTLSLADNPDAKITSDTWERVER